MRRSPTGRRRARRASLARPGAACVLVSGGVDSAALLSGALRTHRSVQPLYVRTGLRWETVEIDCLRRLLAALEAPGLLPLAVIDVPMSDLYGDHWSTTGRRPPAYDAGDASVYLPGRNISLFAKAATFCALRGISVLYSGILGANPFPDGRPRFFRALERALSAGLGTRIRIRTPFRRLAKTEVIRRARGLPLHLTFSCINPAAGGRHCGNCSKCAERVAAFRRAGVPDPTDYAGGPAAREAVSTDSPSGRPVGSRRVVTRAAPNRATSSR